MSAGLVGDGKSGIEVPSVYAKDMDEIISLMTRYLPLYMDELRKGGYRPSGETEKTLQNVFVQSARKNYYFETLPSVTNPLGLSDRSVPLASKVQDLIIGDFLNYLAVRHSVFLSSWDENQKKKVP